jgi:transposase
MVLVLLPEPWLSLRDGKAPLQHSDRRAVVDTQPFVSDAEDSSRQARSTVAWQPRVSRGDHLGAEIWRTLEGPPAAISEWSDLLAPPARMGGEGNLARSVGGAARSPRRAWPARPERDVCGRDLPSREKRGEGIGLTKRGKGTKAEFLVSREGIPLAAVSAPASVGETKLIEPVLEQLINTGCPTLWPEIIIADKAYDSDPLRAVTASVGIQLLAPHRRNRRPESCTNDGRRMRRYRNRWRVERTFAHAGNYRRFTTRYERLLVTANAVVNAVCMLLTLSYL